MLVFQCLSAQLPFSEDHEDKHHHSVNQCIVHGLEVPYDLVQCKEIVFAIVILLNSFDLFYRFVMRLFPLIFCSFALLLLCSCGDEGAKQSEVPLSPGNGFGGPGMAQASPGYFAVDRNKMEGRHIEESHLLSIDAQPDNLKTIYDRDYKKCLEVGCEIMNSTYTDHSRAELNVLLPPDKLVEFLSSVEQGAGKILTHTVNTVDRSLEYIDVEAELKSQEALEGRLTRLLESDKTKTVEDIIAVETELRRVKQSLDSARGKLKFLQKVTALVTVRIAYIVSSDHLDIDYNVLNQSLTRSSQKFIQSLADVITFVARVLPWLPVYFLGLWAFVKMLRISLGKGFFSSLRSKRRKASENEDAGQVSDGVKADAGTT